MAAFLSSNFVLQFFGTIIAILGIAYIYVKNVTFNYWNSRGVTQADYFVPFGGLWPVITAQKSIGEYIRDGYLRFKKSRIFGIYSFHKPTLVVCDPELIRFVLTKEFVIFENRGLYINEKNDPLSANIFFANDTKWKTLRNKFTPTFSSGKIKHMFSTVKECSDNLTRCVADEIQKNKLIEMKDIVARFTTDAIASVAFGIECNSLKNPDAEFRKWGRKFLEPKPFANTLMMLYPSLLKLLNIGFMDKGACNFFIKVFKETVEHRTANKIVRKDFMDSLIQLMHTGYVRNDEGDDTTGKILADASGGKITMLDGAAQAFVFWLAGFESSSSTVTYCLYELAINQDIQDNLADEVNRVLEDFGGLTYESLNAMPYLHKVVSETLRKYPSIPLLNRECGQDVDLPGTGVRIAKGTAVVVSVLGLHSDPDVYPVPDKFDPERFSTENIGSRHNYAYLPFGEGPRNCIGMRFGLLQTKTGIVSLLSKYRFQLGPDTKVPLPVDKGNVFHLPQDGVVLRVEKR